MDLFSKISRQCTSSLESDEKYPDYDTIQNMMKTVSIPKHQKFSTPNYTPSYRKNMQPLSVRQHGRSDDLSEDENSQHKYQFRSSQQEKFNDRQKSIAEHRVFFEEMSLKENLQSYVEKFQSKLDKPSALRDYNYNRDKSIRERTNVSHKTQEDTREMKEEDLQHILTLQSLNYEDAKKLGEFLFHHKISLKIKVFILLRLEDECLDNRDVVRKAFDKSMMQLLEGLLEKYCCTISVFGRKNVQIEDKIRPPRELCLLSPLIKLFSSIACYPNSRFLHAHIISLLINAVTFIASNIDNIQRKIIHVTKGKTLSCDTFKLDPNDTSQLLSNLIGLPLDDWVCGAYEIVVYENTNKDTNKNVNEEIVKIQPNMDCTKLDMLQNNFPGSTVESGKKTITVIRTKAPKYMLLYLETEWRDHLQDISDTIEKVSESKSESYFRNGNVAGFHCNHVEFEHTFLAKVPYLRGLIVSQQKGNVLIWAMDIGTWVYARREKLVCLKHTPLISLEPLVSIGCFKGPICEVDEEFLICSLSILRHAALRNNEIGKMFMPGAGENMLLLAEHHNSSIRRHIFDILLILTKYKEGCVFLHEKGFDVFLAGKLEFWAHITRSGLRQFPRIKTEILVMVKILFAIFSVYQDNKWCGIAQAKRALKILMIGQDQHTAFFEEVLHHIEEVEQHDGSTNRKLTSQVNSEMENHMTKTTKKENYLQMSTLLSQRNYMENGEFDLSHSENEMNRNDTAHNLNKEMPRVKEESAFVYENVTNIKCDSVTHIMECKQSVDIRPVEMTEIICGLLNNNVDGCIFFGLSQDSTVVGITMTENDIKTFTKDVEIIMTKFIRPPVTDCNYSVKFRPVLENRKGRLQVKIAVYVIEMQLYPHKRVVYSLHGGTKYYTRKGSTTIEHNTEKKQKKQSNVKEKQEVADETCKTDLMTESVTEPQRKEVAEDEKTEQLAKEENLSLSVSQRSDYFSSEENYADSSQSFSEIPPSGNLITPVFHFIKKLIPNATNE